jgi:metal-sulfur cluster biosynthetic enzyme
MTAQPENVDALPDEDLHAGHGHEEPLVEPVERMPTKDQILDALRHVHDPELGINIVDLGLVYGVDIDEEAGSVHITYTLTTMGCPIGPLIEAQMQQMLAGFTGIRETSAEMVLRPPWTPDMMSEEAKAALGYF